MLVKFYGDLADRYDPIDLVVDNIPQVLAGLRHVYGQELADVLLQHNHYYVLAKSNNDQDFLALHPKMIASDFGDYDTLMILPDIGGDVTAALVAGVIGVAATSATAIIVAAVINIAISLALSFITQLLSPTLQFDSDPSAAQGKKLDSSLYNGAPNIREQGGSVPIIVGECNAGGVLISAGISSEEMTA